MIKLQEFIFNHPDWINELSNSPYNLAIKEEEDFVLFKYNQISSDFSLPEVQEARGIILDAKQNYKVVCRPFFKFFNYGEELAADIDWNSAVISEKMDGSLIKLWFSDRLQRWIFSTNGTIFARNAELYGVCPIGETFEDLATHAFEDHYSPSDLTVCFDSRYSYIFELVSPFNRIVVPYEETKLYYLTSFNNDTGEEVDLGKDLSFDKPKRYKFSSLDETLEFVKSDSFNNFKNEGFVVSDKYSNRIKIKTEDYLRVHRLRGETIPTHKRILEIILTNEDEEFLSYFPEYEESFRKMTEDLEVYLNELNTQMGEYNKKKDSFDTRKDLALWAKEQRDPNFIFALVDKKTTGPSDYIQQMKIENLLKRIW